MNTANPLHRESPDSTGSFDSFGWISGDFPLFTRLALPVDDTARRDLGVVVVPGFGYVELVARDGWVSIAHRLAAEGFPTLLFDLPGTGASGDIPPCPTGNPRLWMETWVAAVGDAIRALGTQKVVLVGSRLGALVASAAMQQHDIDAQTESMVFWSPTPSGRQFKRELTLLAGTAPGHVDAEGVAFGGFVHPTGLLNEISALSLQPVASRGRQLLVIEDAQRPEPTKALSAFEANGWNISTVRSGETRAWLDASAELAVPPSGDATALLQHLRSVADAMKTVTLTDRPSAYLASQLCATSTLNEHVEIVGPPRLAATIHLGRGGSISSSGLLLLNSGVERAWGPGRAWVDAARKWAADGTTVARVEHSSTGDSGTWPGQARNDVYGSRGPNDIELAVEVLRSAGVDRTVAVGLCSSSFSLLQNGPDPRIAAAVVINPQLFRIGTPPGVVEEATNHVKYWIARVDQVIGLRRTVKAAKRLIGRRHPSFDWIEAFVGSPTKLVLVFGSGDRGLRFLQREDPRKLASLQRAGVELIVIDGLDHALHSPPHRAQVMACIDDVMTRVVAHPVAPSATP